jgi:hypothetical protein
MPHARPAITQCLAAAIGLRSRSVLARPSPIGSVLVVPIRTAISPCHATRGFVFAPDATNAELRSALELRLTADDAWALEFEAAFRSPEITYAPIATAIAVYEESQVFTHTFLASVRSRR